MERAARAAPHPEAALRPGESISITPGVADLASLLPHGFPVPRDHPPHRLPAKSSPTVQLRRQAAPCAAASAESRVDYGAAFAAASGHWPASSPPGRHRPRPPRSCSPSWRRSQSTRSSGGAGGSARPPRGGRAADRRKPRRRYGSPARMLTGSPRAPGRREVPGRRGPARRPAGRSPRPELARNTATPCASPAASARPVRPVTARQLRDQGDP